MTDKDFTQLMLIVDRSGSMAHIANDMNGAIAKLLEEQKKLPGKLRVDVTTFDDKVEFIATDAKVKDVPTDLVDARNWTALNDAVGLSIRRLGDRLAALPEDKRPGKVIVAIVTDGEENHSREYSIAQVKAMIETQQNEFQWEFIFFGVGGLDKVARQSAGYGVTRGSTMAYDHNVIGTQNLAAAASGYMTKSRVSGEKIDISTFAPEPDEDEGKKKKS